MVSRIHSDHTEEAFDPRSWAYSQVVPAVAALETGEEESVPLLRRCLPLLAEARFPHEHALILTYLARAVIATNPNEAESLAAQAETEAREIENAGVANEALAIRARRALARGDVESPETLYQRMLASTQQAHTYLRLIALMHYAEFSIAQRETAKAYKAIREAREIAANSRELMEIDAFSALAALLDGNADQAEADIARARPAAEKAGRRPLLAILTLAEAGVQALRGDHAGALINWQAAIDQAAPPGADWGPSGRAIEEDLLRPFAESAPG